MDVKPEPTDGAWRRSAGVYPGYQVAASFILGWVFVLGGFLCLLYAPVSAWRTYEFVARAVHAKAPIVDFKAYPAGRRQTHETYRPIVEMIAKTSSPVHVLVGAATYPNPFQIGDKIDVIYPPGRPEEAVRANTEDTWGATIGFCIFAPVLLVFGVGILLWMRYIVSHPPDELAWIDRWLLPLKLLTWR